MTDEAEVEHELVSLVLIVFDDDGVAGYFLRKDIHGHCSSGQLLLWYDVDAGNIQS